MVPGWAGTNVYRVVIDPENVVPDSDRSNNAWSDSLFVLGLPDLIVNKLVPSNPTPQQGDAISLRMDVSNLGIDDAEHVRVEVFARSPLIGRVLVGKTFVDHIAPLSTEVVEVDIDGASLVGPIELEVVLDRLEKILEMSDLNNTAQIDLYYSAGLTFTRVGQTLTITGDASANEIALVDDGSLYLSISTGGAARSCCRAATDHRGHARRARPRHAFLRRQALPVHFHR